MATTTTAPNTMPTLRDLLHTGAGVPLGVLAVLSMIIMMAVFYVSRPVEFGVFPTVLLVATLLRLALNVASTRVVLLHGHTGPAAAGKVIQSFGEFVIGGNFAVGVVVF